MNKVLFPSLELAKENQVAGSHIISMETRNQDKNIVRRYTWFTDPMEIYKFIFTKTKANRNFHEIIASNTNVKFYMDIDIDPENEDILESLVGKVVDALNVVIDNNGLAFNINDVLIFINEDSASQIRDRNYDNVKTAPESTTTEQDDKKNIKALEKKQSVHIIYTYYFFQNIRVVKHLVKQVCDLLPEDIVKFIDLGVYKKNQSFRLPFCCKIGKATATMLPITKWSHKGHVVRIDPDLSNIFVKGFIEAKANITITSIQVPTELKISPSLNISPENLAKCIKIAKELLGDTFGCFELSYKDETSIQLNRKKPSACIVCEDHRVHDSIGQYIYLNKTNSGIVMVYGCYRSTKKISRLIQNVY